MASKALAPRACGPAVTQQRSLLQLLLDLSLARLLLALAEASLGPFKAPFRWALAAWHLAAALRRFLLRSLGWLAAPLQSRALRQLSSGSLVEVRRWHVAAGAADRRRPQVLRPTSARTCSRCP